MHSKIFRDDLLQGKVALVTGGGTGIGAAIARELGNLGATVVIASRKIEKITPATKGLTEEIGREVFGEILNLRDRESITACVTRIIEKHGRIDILVNNAGGQFFAPAELITPNGWDAVVATNLTGTWSLTRAVADQWMLKHGGSVLNITMLTSGAFAGMAHSVSARAGVEAMTRTLAVEWAPRGIRINCIAPGYVASAGLRNYPKGLGLVEKMKSVVPMKRLATCDEIAWAAVFLTSPAGEYVTGQTWTVDGGKSLWGDYWPIPDPPDMKPVELPWESWETPDE